MAKLTQFQGDVAREEQGVWVEYAAGVEFRIARLNNPAYQKCLRKLLKADGRRFRRRRPTDENAEKLTNRALAQHVLVDWRNLEDEDGSPIPYSVEKALEILSDPQYHDIRDFVVEVATDSDVFAAEEREDAEGN